MARPNQARLIHETRPVRGPALSALALGVVALVGCQSPDDSLPNIDSVDPAQGASDVDTPITIHGSRFYARLDLNLEGGGGTGPVGDFQVSLGLQDLGAVTQVDAGTLEAVVPRGMAPGLYTVTVTTPAGLRTSLVGAFEVLDPTVVGDTDPGPGDGGGTTCACTGLQTCSSGTCADAAVCTNDSDCVAPSGCVRGVCGTIPECRRDEDCTAPQICFSAQLECGSLTCTNSTECPSALVCDTVNGQCVSCEVDGDCPGTQICVFGECGEDFSTPCTGDIDCVRERTCNTGSCTTPTCTDASPDEPNNAFSTASPISGGLYNLTLSTFDNDYYFVPLNVGDGLLVNISYDATLGEVGLATYDAEENNIDTPDAAGGGGVTWVEDLGAPQNVTTAPGVYIQLYLLDGTCIPVDMRVEVVPGGLCANDLEEPNDGVAMATAIGTDPQDAQRAIKLCAGDKDWFSVDVGASTDLAVTATTTSGTPPYLEVWDSAGTTLLFRDVSGNPNKRIDVPGAGAAASYRVAVEAATADPVSAAVQLGFDVP